MVHAELLVHVTQLLPHAEHPVLLLKYPLAQVVHAVALLQTLQFEIEQALHAPLVKKYALAQVVQAVLLVHTLQLLPHLLHTVPAST